MSLINKLLQTKGHSKADDSRNEPAVFNGLIFLYEVILLHVSFTHSRSSDVDIRSNAGFSIMSKILR